MKNAARSWYSKQLPFCARFGFHPPPVSDLVAPAATATATADAVADETAMTTTTATTTEAKAGQDEVGEGGDVGRERVGLDHREKVLDDGFRKQDMLKWRDAEVLDNSAASADERA